MEGKVGWPHVRSVNIFGEEGFRPFPNAPKQVNILVTCDGFTGEALKGRRDKELQLKDRRTERQEVVEKGQEVEKKIRPKNFKISLDLGWIQFIITLQTDKVGNQILIFYVKILARKTKLCKNLT